VEFPAVMLMEPPNPLVPVPTDIEILPPEPYARALPEDMLTVPALPYKLFALLKMTLPLVAE